MQKIIQRVKNLSARQWGVIFAFFSLKVLAVVYISQYGFGLHPCHLCHLQRIPYFVAASAALILALFSLKKFSRQMLLGVLVLTFVSSFSLALFHFGVENKWWIYASDCTGEGLLTPGASTADFLAALKKAPTTRCDEPVNFLFGMSMAFYNIWASLALLALAIFAFVAKRPSRT